MGKGGRGEGLSTLQVLQAIQELYRWGGGGRVGVLQSKMNKLEVEKLVHTADSETMSNHCVSSVS